jgi:acyl carrier protein
MFMEQNHEQILSTLKDIAKNKLELDFKEVDVNMSVVDDLGLNSLTIFDFIYETEKTFQIELDEKSLLKVKTVSDMIELIHKHLQ